MSADNSAGGDSLDRSRFKTTTATPIPSNTSNTPTTTIVATIAVDSVPVGDELFSFALALEATSFVEDVVVAIVVVCVGVF